MPGSYELEVDMDSSLKRLGEHRQEKPQFVLVVFAAMAAPVVDMVRPEASVARLFVVKRVFRISVVRKTRESLSDRYVCSCSSRSVVGTNCAKATRYYCTRDDTISVDNDENSRCPNVRRTSAA
jgi:hypothetical protein